jgi:hypothetical protein
VAAAASLSPITTNVLAETQPWGLVAIYWFDLGVTGCFGAVAAGFSLYAAMLSKRCT